MLLVRVSCCKNLKSSNGTFWRDRPPFQPNYVMDGPRASQILQLLALKIWLWCRRVGPGGPDGGRLCVDRAGLPAHQCDILRAAHDCGRRPLQMRMPLLILLLYYSDYVIIPMNIRISIKVHFASWIRPNNSWPSVKPLMRLSGLISAR